MFDIIIIIIIIATTTRGQAAEAQSSKYYCINTHKDTQEWTLTEIAMPADQDIPATESVQKRALKIVFPAEESYTEALGQANLPTLQERREDLCYNKSYGAYTWSSWLWN